MISITFTFYTLIDKITVKIDINAKIAITNESSIDWN